MDRGTARVATTAGNNKHYSGAIPTGGFADGTVLQYYVRVAYDDYDTTFLQLNADGMKSGHDHSMRSRTGPQSSMR